MSDAEMSFSPVCASVLTGLAAAVQPPRGLRRQVLLVPDVQGGRVDGVEGMFSAGSF